MKGKRGLSFHFDTDAISSFDLREKSQYLSVLRGKGIITPNEARRMIGLKEHADGNKLESEKLEVEKEKLEMEKELMEGETDG